MAASSDAREADTDGLYALSLDEFTVARDELARALRGEGKREAAQAVKALRKPSVTAWALNQVSRNDPDRVAELVAAGERLQAATQRLLAERDRAPLASATAEERQLVEELAELGERRLATAKHSVSAAAHQKLLATLHAVASDPEARDLLAAGRLVRDYEVSDLGLGMGMAPAASPTPASEAKPKPARNGRAGAADRAAERVAAKLRTLRKQLQSAEASQEELEAEAAVAQRRADDARQEAERASSALERAEAATKQARANARRAAKEVAALHASLRSLDSGQD